MKADIGRFLFILSYFRLINCFVSFLSSFSFLNQRRLNSPSKLNMNVPTWIELDSLLRKVEIQDERQEFEMQKVGRGRANAQASIRLFDEDENYSPEVTLFRDTAAWCPYCEKVWLLLEEKRIPYRVEKIPLRCYGQKPPSFMRMNPSGGLPVAIIKGKVVSESNDIMMILESTFTKNPLLPTDDLRSDRVKSLFALERRLFSTWFQWLTSDKDYSKPMTELLTLVDFELAKDASGPYFLGSYFSMVDIMFTPFLERMAASLPYFKGFEVRTTKFPSLLLWFEAMDSRNTYQGIKSDYYTHCHDLPPQIGYCFSSSSAKPFKEEIDGKFLSIHSVANFEPLIPLDEIIAGRELCRRIIGNHDGILNFMLRAVGTPGQPSVSAPLSDPFAKSNSKFFSDVDLSLRIILFMILSRLIEVPLEVKAISKTEVTSCLIYLRDRIGVPRDMSIHASKILKSYINNFLDQL